MSNWIIKIFIVEYIILAGVCIYEGNWARALYWGSAMGISISVLMGMR